MATTPKRQKAINCAGFAFRYFIDWDTINEKPLLFGTGNWSTHSAEQRLARSTTAELCDNLKNITMNKQSEKTGLVLTHYLATKINWILDNVDGAEHQLI